MAGSGRVPKPPEQRRNHHPPRAGEWIMLPELAEPVLPPLPARGRGAGRWSARTRAAWRAWRADPVTALYGPADVQLAVDLAWLYEDWVREPTATLAAELRQLRDSLGLSPKGRQDRRWRLGPPAPIVELDDARQRRNRRRLRAVDPALVGTATMPIDEGD